VGDWVLGSWLLGCGIAVSLASVWRQEGLLAVAALLLVLSGVALLRRDFKRHWRKKAR
jgi:hypothetical protein